MAYITHAPSTILSTAWTHIANLFEAFARAITVSAAMDARMNRVNKLNAKTDAELAEMNLRRADIPAYVFRDLMHI